MSAPFDLLIRNTSEVLTCQGGPGDRGEALLFPIPAGAIGVQAGRIAFLGPESTLPQGAVGPATRVLDAQGGFAGPGLVDPHTHLVFAGERAGEFELRAQGASYLEIAAAGGGIMSTVRATRAASVDQLVAQALPRLGRLLAQGVTTAEVKSGYGLDVEHELAMLRAVRALAGAQPVELVPTLLCAHAVPEEHKASRGRYLDLCERELLPEVARSKLARFCDAFVEEGAFTHDEARSLLQVGASLGLTPRLHADQLTANGGAQLAAELGAASADHLERISADGIAALARAGTVAVLVPTSTLFLRQRPYAPGRALRQASVAVALGSNVNPGSAMSENLGLSLGLACLENGLTAAEVFWATTRGGAMALRLERGQLRVGGAADLVVFACRSYRHLPYHLGVNHARWVIKGGQVVVENDSSGAAFCLEPEAS